MYPVVEHTRTNYTARNHSRSRAPHHRTQSNAAKDESIFILRPTSVRMWHKAVFKVGPVAWPKPNVTGSSKNASDPVGIPFFRAPQASGDKPTPPKSVKAWEDGHLRPEVMYPVVEHTRTNCAARNHIRSRAPHHRTQSNAAKDEPTSVEKRLVDIKKVL